MTDIHEALLQARRSIGVVGKDDKNDYHNFFYRGVDRIINSVGPALLSAGVNFLPELLTLESRDVPTKKDGVAREVTVTVSYTYYTADGSSHRVVVPGEAQDSGGKAVSKAMAVAMRTAHIQALQIPSGDVDPDASSVVRAESLSSLKNKVWKQAEKLGWIAVTEEAPKGDFTRLAAEYASWSDGGDLTTANESELTGYLAHLAPAPETKTVQRRPVQRKGGRS